MAETLGSLCDKLTIVKLKEWHSQNPERLALLSQQSGQLVEEIDEFLASALKGEIPRERLSFAANKVFRKQGNEVPPISGSLGYLVSELARINCDLWHQQEKVYEFEIVPHSEKDMVIKVLARLNLSRNECIDAIDRIISEAVYPLQSSAPDSSR